jgi:hypothetical protein
VSADAVPVCPVCQWPAREESHCRHCGWQLMGGYVVGTPPTEAQQELTRSIASARRRYALRVAVRAASWRARVNLGRLAELAGAGTPPSDREIEDTVAAYDEQAPLPAAIGIGFTLSRLVAGDTDAIEFAEISPDGLSVCALVADELGVPGLRPGGQVHWTDILPELPADDDLRLYLLAGVAGDAAATDPAALATSVAEAAGREVARLTHAMTNALRRSRSAESVSDDAEMARPPLTQPDTVLVCRTQRWPSLDAGAAMMRAVIRPVAEIYAPGPTPLSAIVTETVRWAPLRYEYCLVLAAVDQRNGRVWPTSSPLFPAGTTGQQRVFPTVDIPVMAATAADRLVLPVVARCSDNPAGWRAVGAGVMDGTTAGITRVRVRLEAPGRVSVSATPKLVPGTGVPGWPDVLVGLPGWLPGMVMADVVLLAELGGHPDTVADRMSLLDSVVGGLGRTGIKVAIVGYREHWERYPAGLIVECGLADAADIRPMLARRDLWRAVDIRDKHAAPIEDALATIAQPDWAWRPGARHLLVVFASRPPHPRSVDARGELRASQCQNGHSWQDILDRLRREQAVECMVVLPEREAHTPAGDYAERAWAEFGKAGLFHAERSPAADLLRAIGIGQADDGARLPLAMGVPDGRPEDRRGEEGSR